MSSERKQETSYQRTCTFNDDAAESLAVSSRDILLIDRCVRTLLNGCTEASDTKLEPFSQPAVFRNASAIQTTVADRLQVAGVTCLEFIMASPRRVAEELLQRRRGLLCIGVEGQKKEHALWVQLREVLGISPTSSLLFIVLPRIHPSGHAVVEIVDPRSGRNTQCCLRDLIEACQNRRCDALFLEALPAETPGLKHASDSYGTHLFPATVDGKSCEEFLEWAAGPATEKNAIVDSILHAHQTQLSAEPGQTSYLLPITERR